MCCDFFFPGEISLKIFQLAKKGYLEHPTQWMDAAALLDLWGKRVKEANFIMSLEVSAWQS